MTVLQKEAGRSGGRTESSMGMDTETRIKNDTSFQDRRPGVDYANGQRKYRKEAFQILHQSMGKMTCSDSAGQ